MESRDAAIAALRDRGFYADGCDSLGAGSFTAGVQEGARLRSLVYVFPIGNTWVVNRGLSHPLTSYTALPDAVEAVGAWLNDQRRLLPTDQLQTETLEVYWEGYFVGRYTPTDGDGKHDWGNWEDLGNQQFHEALLRIRNMRSQREPDYGSPSSKPTRGLLRQLWIRVVRWALRSWPGAVVMRRRVLAHLRQQHDFVSLKQIRESLGFPEADPTNPVHRALAWLGDANKIVVIVPHWTGPHYAVRGTAAIFPEHRFLPVVERCSQSDRYRLAYVTAEPGLASPVFRSRWDTSYVCSNCQESFEAHPKLAHLETPCPRCGCICPSREFEAIRQRSSPE
jgi:hypothetical protein